MSHEPSHDTSGSLYAMGEMSQVNGLAVYLRTQCGVYCHPCYACKKHKAWRPVEKRYMGNCNGFRYINGPSGRTPKTQKALERPNS